MNWLDYLPEYWQQRVRQLALQQSGGKYDTLGASAFSNQHVIITFPDGSSAHFRHAFYLREEARNEVLVLTEHCGYHVFPLEGLVLEVLDPIYEE